MNLRRKAQDIALSITVTGLLLGGVSVAQEPNPQIWGEAVNGLQMRIYSNPVDRSQFELPKFTVELRNAGKRDLSLMLGADCGKLDFSAVLLLLADAEGKSRRLQLNEPDMICGSYKPLVRAIPVGASLSIPIDLEAYWPGLGEPEYSMKPGSYSLEAQFTGTDARQESLQLGVNLRPTPFWTGTVKSNMLRFEVLEPITLHR